MPPFLTFLTISIHFLPALSHRLITDPYPHHQWDSIIVSSDPITITDPNTRNSTHSTHSTQSNTIRKRRSLDCPQNDFACLYGTDDSANDRIVHGFLHQYTNLQSDDSNLSQQKETDPRNSYWTMVDSQTHNHPFDDKNGWVTLDPVPWSTSKIAKWHPNKVGVQQEGKPWGYGGSTQRPVQQFWVSGSSHGVQRPSTQWGIGTNDIITDNKPSGFPTGHYGGPPRGQNYEGGYGQYNQYEENYDTKGVYPQRGSQSHPSTYPSNGNGEWVLLSTTKGYSHPQRNRWGSQKNLKPSERVFASRRIKTGDLSKYHEEDLQDKNVNRKSDDNTNSTSAEPSLQILHTGNLKEGEPVRTVRRKVRLQVLPSLESSSTSHGGLLEVDSNQQTVDEAQQEDEKMQKLKAIANVKKNRIRGYKLVPTSKLTGKGMSDKNMMTLAAVGAGMIPATMALLVPMALGRRRRSVYDERSRERL